jgi:large subunit ribosomal protein L24
MKFHVKKGEEVVVLAGREKGKRGKIITINSTKQRVVVEGVQMIKRHTAKSGQQAGSIVEREGSVHISNVMAATNFDARASKRGATSEPAAAN